MVRTCLCLPLGDPKVFSDDYEPTCCCCIPNGLILIASGSGSINVYSAPGGSISRVVHRFSTVGISRKLVYCTFRGFIASLESKSNDITRSGTNNRGAFHHARVYVNWTKITEESVYLTHHRIGYTKETSSIHSYVGQFLVIDIPLKYSVTDIACCNSSGNIAVSTEAKVYLYFFKEFCIGGNSKDNFAIDFDCVLEIDSRFQINQIALFQHYIAFASPYEIRAVHIALDTRDLISQAEDVTEIIEEVNDSEVVAGEKAFHCSVCQSTTDENFVLWNIDQGCSQGLDGLEHETVAISRRKTASSSFSTPTYVVERSCVKFDTIAQDATYVDLGNTAKEILGPKENIKGHPLLVIYTFNDSYYGNISHVTLLYRRFYNEEYDPNSEGLYVHSLQWLPLYADMSPHTSGSPSSSPVDFTPSEKPSESTLLSLGLFFSTGRKGYLYDLMNTPRLLTEYDFTEYCISACLTRTVLHVVTKRGMETYTTRLYSSASENARSIFGESSTAFLHRYDRERAYSSVSFSSGSEFDSKSQLSEISLDLSEDEPNENQDDIRPKEDYFSQVPSQPRAGSATASKSRLSFGRRKKHAMDRQDSKSPTSETDGKQRERLWSFSCLSERLMPAVYKSYDLAQPCPPTSTETCLIAIYYLEGFAFVGATEKHVVLLQQTFEFKGRRSSLMKEKTMLWKVVVRRVAPAFEVSREIMKLIEGSEFANPSVYHQLLSEAHMFLRIDLASNMTEEKREVARSLVRRSAVKLGDFFSRCDSSFDYFLAKEYYRMAGIKLEQVLLRHALRDKDENLGKRYGVGIIQYLNEKIRLAEEETIEMSEESAAHVLNIYAVAAPQLLANVIIRSKVKNIPAEKAILLFERFMKTELGAAEYRLSSLDFIAMAVLHLQLCDPAHAENTLRRLTKEQLVDAVAIYPDILWNGENLSHLGQLLRRHFVKAFADLLVSLYDKEVISLHKALRAYGLDSISSSPSGKQSFKVVELLETLLNDERRKDDFPEIASHLLQQYISWLKSKPQPELLKIPHKHIPKGNGHFAARYEWLDTFPPFSGELPVPQDCVLRRQQQQQRASKSNFASPENSPSNSRKSSESSDLAQPCSCCCCNSVLLKIQSLLCSPYCTTSTYEVLLEFCEENDVIGEDSIKLLCFPFTGKTLEAVEFVVEKYPSIMLHYGRDVFQIRKDQWKIFLGCLLRTLRGDLYERWNKETYLEALKGTLMRLACLCQPAEYISLLPKDGTARFFLPFVLDCYQINKTVAVRTEILQISGTGMT